MITMQVSPIRSVAHTSNVGRTVSIITRSLDLNSYIAEQLSYMTHDARAFSQIPLLVSFNGDVLRTVADTTSYKDDLNEAQIKKHGRGKVVGLIGEKVKRRRRNNIIRNITASDGDFTELLDAGDRPLIGGPSGAEIGNNLRAAMRAESSRASSSSGPSGAQPVLAAALTPAAPVAVPTTASGTAPTVSRAVSIMPAPTPSSALPVPTPSSALPTPHPVPQPAEVIDVDDDIVLQQLQEEAEAAQRQLAARKAQLQRLVAAKKVSVAQVEKTIDTLQKMEDSQDFA